MHTIYGKHLQQCLPSCPLISSAKLLELTSLHKLPLGARFQSHDSPRQSSHPHFTLHPLPAFPRKSKNFSSHFNASLRGHFQLLAHPPKSTNRQTHLQLTWRKRTMLFLIELKMWQSHRRPNLNKISTK